VDCDKNVADNVTSMTVPSPAQLDDQLELIQLLPEDDDLTVALTHDLMKACLPLVVALAQELAARSPEAPVADLVQEGIIAVQLRVRKFKPGRQAWPKYLRTVARRSMCAYISTQGEPVYLSQWTRRRLFRAQRQARASGTPLQSELERQGLGEASRVALSSGLHPATISEARDMQDWAPPVDEVLQAHQQYQAVRERLDVLDHEQAEVLALAFGFDDSDEGDRTDAQIARILKVPVSRVTWLRTSGLAELRMLMQTG
jgi:RNA polymerase sigma factor (sigma-70 family)